MTPEQIAKNGSEHSEQAALLAWAAMAAINGVKAAADPQSYTTKGYGGMMLAVHKDADPRLRLMFAINNAVGRNSAAHGARNKAEGVKSGVPDLFLPVAKIHAVTPIESQPGKFTLDLWHGLFLEMKRRDLYKETNQIAGTSTEQKKWISDLYAQQFAVAVCYGWQHARDTILTYLAA